MPRRIGYSERYTFALDPEQYEAMAVYAVQQEKNVVDKMREYLKLGLIAEQGRVYIQLEDGTFAQLDMREKGT